MPIADRNAGALVGSERRFELDVFVNCSCILREALRSAELPHAECWSCALACVCQCRRRRVSAKEGVSIGSAAYLKSRPTPASSTILGVATKIVIADSLMMKTRPAVLGRHRFIALIPKLHSIMRLAILYPLLIENCANERPRTYVLAIPKWQQCYRSAGRRWVYFRIGMLYICS